MSEAYAHLEGQELVVGNALIERRWQVRSAELVATSLWHKQTGKQWAAAIAPAPSLSAFANAPRLTGDPVGQEAVLRTPVSEEFLRAELMVPTMAGQVTYRFDVFDAVPAITMQLIAPASDISGKSAREQQSGMEVDQRETEGIDCADLVDCLALDALHCDFTVVEIGEQTDGRENLVFERRWMLHPAETHARAQGNLFFVEHRATGEGLIFLKHAPAPYARPVRAQCDCAVVRDVLQVRGHGLMDGGEGYPHSVICYAGGKAGRIAALQRFQHQLRTYVAGRDGLLLSNTWGDRNRDAAISESFLLAEVDAGARLGVDVVQIDDGWQRGRSANSAKGSGKWEGFWASEGFWQPDTTRLPNGLAPITTALARNGMSLGLWYAPDSVNDCANWKKDAERVLELWRRDGVSHVKIDAVKIRSKLAEQNVARFYQHVLEESGGKICFDPDVTAEIRPGFWGLMNVGPIFVENRYTDWHRYWPHHTLRNLWLLSHYIPPVRLRMEFLNVARHQDKYRGDPLAPANWSPDTLFATVMFASPLGWFEVSRLPEAYFKRVAPLIRIWRQHRQATHRGPVIPIGTEPDGFGWTGFCTHSGQDRDYAVVFNQLANVGSWELPMVGSAVKGVEVLHGEADARCTSGRVEISIPKPLSHAFVLLKH